MTDTPAEYSSEQWQIHLPDGWEVLEADPADSDDDAGVVVYHPDGVGELYISCSELEDGLVEPEDLEHFASELLEAGLTPARVQLGGLHGLLFEHVTDEQFWQEWFMASDEQFFYITYNCPVADRGAEDTAIHHILHSLEVLV